jgi:hypothetical protein
VSPGGLWPHPPLPHCAQHSSQPLDALDSQHNSLLQLIDLAVGTIKEAEIIAVKNIPWHIAAAWMHHFSE